MDVLLLHALASAGMCLPSRCLAMGLCVTTLCWVHCFRHNLLLLHPACCAYSNNGGGGLIVTQTNVFLLINSQQFTSSPSQFVYSSRITWWWPIWAETCCELITKKQVCVTHSVFVSDISNILSSVRGSVTNNNGFWIRWLDLLTPSLQSLLITINDNSWQSIYCRGPAPFSFSCLNSVTTSEQTQRSHVSSLCNFRKDRIEITTSNSSSVVVCLFVAAETCLASCCLAMDVSAALPWLHTSGEVFRKLDPASSTRKWGQDFYLAGSLERACLSHWFWTVCVTLYGLNTPSASMSHNSGSSI
jgi:hypothetical protein